jgi:hypothetical protein
MECTITQTIVHTAHVVHSATISRKWSVRTCSQSRFGQLPTKLADAVIDLACFVPLFVGTAGELAWRRAISIGTIEGLDQGQKSKGTGAGWKFLLELLRWSNGYLCEVEVSNVIQVSFLWARRARERQLGLNGAKCAELRS